MQITTTQNISKNIFETKKKFLEKNISKQK